MFNYQRTTITRVYKMERKRKKTQKVHPFLASSLALKQILSKAFPDFLFPCPSFPTPIDLVPQAFIFPRVGVHAQSCPTLCDPMDCSPLGSSVHRILQARILEWVAFPFSRGSSQSRGQTWISCLEGKFFTRQLSHQGSPLDMSIVMANLHCCMAETKTTLQSNYPSI